MRTSLLDDAFGHHVWATLTLLDVCLGLGPAQLETSVPGTYGSILDTTRHTVGADRSYLFVIGGAGVERVDEDTMDLGQLKAVMKENGPGWTAVLAEQPDPDTVLRRHRNDGTSTDAPVSIRIAQALHHGTDHRSQICTALTTIGIEPPGIDVWDYGHLDGRVVDLPSPA